MSDGSIHYMTKVFPRIKKNIYIIKWSGYRKHDLIYCIEHRRVTLSWISTFGHQQHPDLPKKVKMHVNALCCETGKKKFVDSTVLVHFGADGTHTNVGTIILYIIKNQIGTVYTSCEVDN